MSVKKISPEQLTEYFDAFTRRFLGHGSPDALNLAVVAREWDGKPPVNGAALLGIHYDSARRALEFELRADHYRVVAPREVWVIETPDGFVHAIDVVRPDGRRELVRVQRVGARGLTRATTSPV